MTKEKKVKFSCTKLKVHAMIWCDHVPKKKKVGLGIRWKKKLRDFFFLWTMPNPFFVDFRT
jgi:hypothetical protein